MSSASTDPPYVVEQRRCGRAADLGGERRGEQRQRLHRLPQVMAHRSQELGLGEAGALGLILGGAQILLGTLALGDVADDAGEDARAADQGFAHRHVHGKDRALLALALDFPADADDAPLSRRHVALEVAIVGATIGLRHQHIDLVAHHLVDAIAEDALGGLVGGEDRSLLVDGDDAVHRCSRIARVLVSLSRSRCSLCLRSEMSRTIPANRRLRRCGFHPPQAPWGRPSRPCAGPSPRGRCR
jgi:hypothetical protein